MPYQDDPSDVEPPSRPPKPERLDPQTPISLVEPIRWPAGMLFSSREELEYYVEQPLRKACQELFDKKIKTVESSANRHSLENGATYISLYYDYLSEANRNVVRDLRLPQTDTLVTLPFPLNRASTIEDVEQSSLNAAAWFEPQDRWNPHPMGLAEARATFALATGRMNELATPEELMRFFVLDETTGLYFDRED